MTAGPRIHTALEPVPGAIDQDEVAPLHSSPDPTPWHKRNPRCFGGDAPPQSIEPFKIPLRAIMGLDS
ncbi:hypothetical protein E4U15_002121 [Claviceps sp. LM218 group G6]|nr:hypothetical protein E4U15_002121 [Claviceps sp. LM218 group G6]